MKDIDLNYYKYIKTIYDIKNIDQDLLRLFNEYISSNKDFKYNKSYLDDSIGDFMECVNAFKRKQEFVKNTKKSLSKKYKSLNNWIIILDNVFMIDSQFNLSLLTDTINSYNDKTKYILKQQLEQFNLYSMDHNNIKIYYYNTQSEADYTQSKNINKSFNILNLVSKELKKNRYLLKERKTYEQKY